MHSLNLPATNLTVLQKALKKYYFSKPTELDDNILIKKSINGDGWAFKIIMGKYLKPVYNFLYQLTKDPSVVDDLTQETFIKAWKNLSRFSQTKSFKVWIFTIAKNTAYDFLKKKKSIPFSSIAEEDSNNLEEIIDDKPLPDELLERKDLEKELSEKLNQIADIYRVILLLHYKDDFSLSEISEILNEPYNTIKSRHQRGMQKLKSLLIDS